MKKFKPKLIPTLFTILVFMVLITLGTWQVERLEWKLALIDKINKKLENPILELPAKIDVEDMQYSIIKVTGQFLNNDEMYLYAGPKYMGGESGYDILTPFKRLDGSFVLIDRGWVPESKKQNSARPNSLIEGTTEVVGMVQKGEHRTLFMPENQPAKNLWLWIDIANIAKYYNVDLGDYYIRRIKQEADGANLPIGGDKNVHYRNDHLQYAITWYSLAFILLIIYFLSHYKKVDE